MESKKLLIQLVTSLKQLIMVLKDLLKDLQRGYNYKTFIYNNGLWKFWKKTIC